MVGLLIAYMKGFVLVQQVTYMYAVLALVICPESLLERNVVAQPTVHSGTISIFCECPRSLALC